uniref:Uncharacterized protein n=1 Tax=Arundo donax TaxID=35708 RepID=A0A0A9HHK4_ARUDO
MPLEVKIIKQGLLSIALSLSLKTIQRRPPKAPVHSGRIKRADNVKERSG